MPPKAKKAAAPAPPEFLTVEDLAAARGTDPYSIRSAVYRARRASAKGMPDGMWPKDQIPQPDRGRPLLGWDPRRPEVQAYVNGAGPKYPLLENRDELFEEYVTKDRGAAAIAKELGCVKDTVINALDRHGIPVREGAVPSALADVPLADLLAAIEEGPNLAAVARKFGVLNEATVRRAVLRKQAAEAQSA